jgi:hypothetical protein
MTRHIFLFVVLIYLGHHALSQYKPIIHYQQLDSICQHLETNVKTVPVIGYVSSFGKAGNVVMDRLDSLGLLQKQQYSTALLVYLADSAVTYYAPIKNKYLTQAFLNRLKAQKDIKVAMEIKIFAKGKRFKNKAFFVITKIRPLEAPYKATARIDIPL